MGGVAIVTGGSGIEHKLEPEPPVEGNAYEKKFPKRLQLPGTLWEAAQRLKASKMARVNELTAVARTSKSHSANR